MSFWKKLRKILAVVVVVAAVFFAPVLIAKLATVVGGNMVAAGALYGAAAGAVTGGLWTGTLKGTLKGAAVGGLIGGAAGFAGVGSPGGVKALGGFGNSAGWSSSGAVAPAASQVPAVVPPAVGPQVATNAQKLGSVVGQPTATLYTPPLTSAQALQQATVAGAKQTGKYMLYAEGVKLLGGGVTGAMAAKGEEEERKRVEARQNYQVPYKSVVPVGAAASRVRASSGLIGV